jgi:hypothetical protein
MYDIADRVQLSHVVCVFWLTTISRPCNAGSRASSECVLHHHHIELIAVVVIDMQVGCLSSLMVNAWQRYLDVTNLCIV